MQKIIVKTNNTCVQQHKEINKIIATIDAKNFVKLLNVVTLDANPRKSKQSNVTQDIQETLNHNPEYMRFMSKGLLISTLNCKALDRGRFEMTFDDSQFEGILDGGHNLLAIGLFILETCANETNLKRIRTWQDFIEKWKNNKLLDQELLSGLEFEVPIEVIYPSQIQLINTFKDKVFDISKARNNNSQLTDGTQANHKGYYEILKYYLETDIRDNIEWKDNEPNKDIKRDSIIAMSLIPLIALQKDSLLNKSVNIYGKQKQVSTINPVSIYSSTNRCVKHFSEFFEIYSDSNDNQISDTLIKSALALVKDLPKLFDTIYKNFPTAYNAHSPRFGGIDGVKIYEEGKKAGGRYLRKKPATLYYQEECDYKYSDGFIMPVFISLYKLMTVKDNQLVWRVSDPNQFIKDNLEDIIALFVNTIKDNNYTPNLIGKNSGSYQAIEWGIQIKLNSK